jgi:hypothetical protein
MPPPTGSLKPSPASAAAGKPEKAEKAEKGEKRQQKPDATGYSKEQDELNKEIEVVKKELVSWTAALSEDGMGADGFVSCALRPLLSFLVASPFPHDSPARSRRSAPLQNEIRSKLSLLHAPQTESDRRTIIKSELDALQSTQRDAKTDRTKLFDALKRTQEAIAQKVKDSNAQRGKLPVKNVDEAEKRIAALDKQIESGTLKLIDEKKALAEISALKRAMGALQKVSALEEAIAAEIQARWDELKKEMDGLREEGKKAWDERNALFEKRNELQKQMVSVGFGNDGLC